MLGSKRNIEKQVGKEVQFLSYPIGGFSEEVKKLVRESGYRGACTTNRGYDRLNKDVYELKRVRFNNKDNKYYYVF